jgi:Fe-S-cluster-containing hydrogenase component 2
MAMDNTGTIRILSRQHGDRWSSFGEHTGIVNLSSLLHPDQLRRIEILEEFDDEFLRDISTDVALARWKGGAVVFEAGTYLDLAFLVVDGQVEMALPRSAPSHRPIFTARDGKGGRPVVARVDAGSRSRERRAKEDAPIVFLAAADFDLIPGERIRLGPGELFGEIGAMNGWPQSVTARTATPCTLLQIRLAALRKVRRKSKRLKQRLDELYRSRALRQHLHSTPLLEGFESGVIDQLAARVELISCQPDEVVTREGDPVEHLILVRSGSLRMSQTLGTGQVAVSYVSKGDTVGEAELVVDDLGAFEVTTTSVGYSELVRIPRADVLDVIARYPALEQRLWAIASERINDIGSRRLDLERADSLDFSLAKGLTQANSVLVIDLDSCTRCDDCVRACASTHGGTPRFVREGEVHQGFMVARSCYHCQDPTCLVGCPTGAIKRLNVGDVVAIDPGTCIGCGACAENCMYDAIVMHDLETTWGPDALPEQLRGQPRAVATKCDLCHTAAQGPACVTSCPHGAAYRVAGAEEFDLLLQAKRRSISA